jgi:four helix bundle protein
MKLGSEICRVTAIFPKHERYGLSQQMYPAAVSVPSDIAEGKGHRSDKGFANFLVHARGSLLEFKAQVEIARDLEYVPEEQAARLLGQTKTVGRSLTGLVNSLSAQDQPHRLRSAKCSAHDRRPATDN